MSNLKCQMSNENAFTLIELLVVITITSIFAAFGIISFKSTKEDHEIKRENLKIASLFETAQTNASASVNCGSLGSGATWIVKIEPQSLNNQVKLLCRKDSTTVEVKSINLDKNIIEPGIACISGHEALVSNNGLEITYAPLTGVGTIGGFFSTSQCKDDFILRLKSATDENKTNDLTVYSQGLTNVEK